MDLAPEPLLTTGSMHRHGAYGAGLVVGEASWSAAWPAKGLMYGSHPLFWVCSAALSQGEKGPQVWLRLPDPDVSSTYTQLCILGLRLVGGPHKKDREA